MSNYVIQLNQLTAKDIDKVGGKNASLGEMLGNLSGAGVNVPDGVATTAEAFWDFLQAGGLYDRIHALLDKLDINDIHALVSAGKTIRGWVMAEPFRPGFEQAIVDAYQTMCEGKGDIPVAVRSSATAEDLPDASFAGQQETFLNICGADNVLQAVREVFASLFNDRAIAYRVHHGFDHRQVALSAGIQRMVRSETGASGVMFTLDTESGFNEAVFITSSYGLGETVVQGAVNPDEFYVHKPAIKAGHRAILRRNLGSKAIKMVYSGENAAGRSVNTVDVDTEQRRQFSLSDSDVTELARQAVIIEDHYGCPMDIEWAKDGDTGTLYVVQARPETVQSRALGNILERYQLHEKGTILAEGRSIGQRIGQGAVRMIRDSKEMHRVQEGDVLVTDMTDPDWEPVMQRASAIVTNRGGRTCHAAIIARELAIPAVVGCGDATCRLTDGQNVTVSCAEGDMGFIYEGLLDYRKQTRNLDTLPALPFEIMMNVGNPDRAFSFSNMPNAGVGLARVEFIIAKMIGIHPKALLNYPALSDELKGQVNERIAGYADPVSFYVDKLAEGVATIAAAFSPRKVIVRLSDFKSNEYANLIGGQQYEPHEENPMIGFRGASRYLSKDFRDCFELECRAIKQVRDELKLTNVQLMVPFVRTPDEAKQVVELLDTFGLRRGEKGLKLIMMCELPANALLADEFLQYFDGFSIGSNDMTQLTLGLDRDSGLIAHLFDERNAAIKKLLSMAIAACKKQGKYVGICGQGPSDHPDFARWLMEEGIDTVSLNPDSVIETWLYLADQS
ncbi:phosphoenolpyruvate synthase [Candidatus Sororendozoicomonas aggregata]|uniref:phosphoenolpyruvate synthase n=1 Tax=Candidatus Sororendozoicomonas aggregata TaxID=3073239 RepID=UPI002ED354DF